MKNKTAVEWLLNLTVGEDADGNDVTVRDSLSEIEIEQAKEMFEEQIVEAYDACCDDIWFKDGEDYYKKTFKSE